VVEEKAIFSVEKFILSRRMMYWQVYLHKTSIVAEQILGRFIDRYKELYKSGRLGVLLMDKGMIDCFEAENSDQLLTAFLELDDINIWMLLKNAQYSDDEILALLSKSLVQRRLWKIILQNSEISCDLLIKIRLKIVNYKGNDFADYLMISGSETNQLYNIEEDEILVLNKKGIITPLSEHTIIENIGLLKRMHYVCYPKQID
jgi:HD superfamily phosphohydrolase